MIPAAARAVIAAHLTDELDVHPHLASLVVASLADRLALDGWHMTDSYPARPVAPRARETRGARRALDRLLCRARPDSETTP
ncbi:hypothetical protein R6L23_20035 [Streptomyces sp. SR27]|uniref:hypothetical protein n=1 Tax=Streptomyces sp. SR27 TaxID=3076630 RepID=UPI00295A6CAE|nr:hypothetical protein [Streptomyces sp. SR27]MDV9190478.1 hypothetical protein [Streptomyces sp. SR27]